MILKDKIALITGASGGIGGAIAQEFAAAGATVIITGRNAEKLKECAGGKCEYIIADLAADGAADKLIADVIEKHGRIDILVNNAGVTRDGPLMRMTDEAFDTVIDTNLRACFQLCRAASVPMMKNKYGRIINVASIVGVIGNAFQANYAASKGGMIAMTKSIAAELASRGITANCIAPGFIKTAMTDALSDEIKKQYLAQIPSGRFGEPADVANAAVFLASDMASYISGQTIHVNGAMGRF